MSTELLIDGDVVVYQFAHRAQTTVRLTKNIHGTFAREDKARVEIEAFILGLVEKLEADTYTIVLSDNTANFRNTISSDYKSNRNADGRPMLYPILREVLRDDYGAVSIPTLEGDDVLGIMATDPFRLPDGKRIIVTIDKDLKTVPGLTYDWTHDERGVVETSVAEAHRFHMFQTLTGDPTDGYKGCPKVGKVGANKILDADGAGDYWESVVNAFKKAKLNERIALENAQCARILQDGDYDFHKNEVVLWLPEGGLIDDA